jgi:hypothetical protein
LKRLQRGLARKKKGSNNRKKWKLKIGRAHERVSNLRSDFLHKFTSDVTKRFSIVCVENLCLKGWIGLAGKSAHDAGVGLAINQLEYKTEEVGGKLQKVGRFFASSKRCHVCGYVKDDLELREREWKCPSCEAEHDRDENGAINIEMATHSESRVCQNAVDLELISINVEFGRLITAQRNRWTSGIGYRFFQISHFWQSSRGNKLKWPISVRMVAMGPVGPPSLLGRGLLGELRRPARVKTFDRPGGGRRQILSDISFRHL